jgi:hypothetical protein
MDGKKRDRVYYCSFTVGWGRVYQDYLWVAELMGERAPTNLSSDFTGL